jgi:formamidopyrimidine-DNA glycosylase
LPELPEVETIKRALTLGGRGGESVLGCQIVQADVLWPRTLQTPDIKTFKNRIEGQVIQSISRRAKYLLLHLDQDVMLMHLRMSGDVRVDALQNRSETLQKHDRLVLWFANQRRLVFNNPRKFGRVWLVSDPEDVLSELGPEPLDPDFTADQFYTNLKKHKRQLKALLLDQHFLAGLGNIYTDEALFLAGLNPTMNTQYLNYEQGKRLFDSIRTVLETGIRRNGASIDWVYRGGQFQNEFKVYGRRGKTCYVCGSMIERIIVGQRGTHFCPECQNTRDTTLSMEE